MKRFAVLLLLIISIPTFLVSANSYFSADNIEIKAGKDFDIDFSFEFEINLMAYQMDIVFDRDILTALSVKQTSGDGQLMYNINEDEGEISLAYAAASLEEHNSTIFRIKFSTNSSNWNETDIKIENQQFFGENGSNIDIKIKSPKVANINFQDLTSYTETYSESTETETPSEDSNKNWIYILVGGLVFTSFLIILLIRKNKFIKSNHHF